MKYAKFVLGLLILVLVSCYLPQNPANLDGKETADQLSVLTDKDRQQGVYVNEKGAEFDILVEEGEESEVVRCVEALDIVRVGTDSPAGGKSSAGPDSVKALIVGKRQDGYPGVWEVGSDDSIQPVSGNESGQKSSKAGDSCEAEWMIHGWFGWTYNIVYPFLGPDSEGGFIIVGYAENVNGIDFGGKWVVNEGATVAVYWRLHKMSNGHFHLSRARIIGEPSENYSKWFKSTDLSSHHRYRHSMVVRFLRYLFASFKFFFLDSFDVYLVDVLEAEYDAEQNKYLVTGHVEKEADTVTPVVKVEKSDYTLEEKVKLALATAAIDPYGEIVITIDDGNGGGGTAQTYDSIVVEAYPPIAGMGQPTIEVALMADPAGEPLEDTNLSATRVEISELLADAYYYIRVTSGALGDQPYALRVLAPSGVEPAAIQPGTINASDAPYETDDGVPDKNPMQLGNDNYVNRYFGVQGGDTVDWLKVYLPPL